MPYIKCKENHTGCAPTFIPRSNSVGCFRKHISSVHIRLKLIARHCEMWMLTPLTKAIFSSCRWPILALKGWPCVAIDSYGTFTPPALTHGNYEAKEMSQFYCKGRRKRQGKTSPYVAICVYCHFFFCVGTSAFPQTPPPLLTGACG